MDVTIVNPICARLAQPGHDAQVSIETSTTVALDCCLSDVQDGGAVDAPPIWGGLAQVSNESSTSHGQGPPTQPRVALGFFPDHCILRKHKQKKPAQLVV